MMMLGSGQRMAPAGEPQRGAGSEPGRLPRSQCIRIKADPRTQPASAGSAMTQVNGHNIIGMPRDYEQRAGNCPALVTEFRLLFIRLFGPIRRREAQTHCCCWTQM